jgi:hypothetical protein
MTPGSARGPHRFALDYPVRVKPHQAGKVAERGLRSEESAITLSNGAPRKVLRQTSPEGARLVANGVLTVLMAGVMMHAAGAGCHSWLNR